MSEIVNCVAILLLVAYVCIAVWVIWHMRTVKSTVATSAGFLCGGFIIVPLAQIAATIVCVVIFVGLFYIVMAVMGSS